MKNKSRARAGAIAGVVVGLGLFFGLSLFAHTRTQLPFSKTDQAKTNQKETLVTKHASGAFDVKMSPQVDDKVGDPTVGRMALDKEYRGDLEATSKGQMLATMTDVQGSAGYVAMERVNGTLGGHSGTFALQHTGTMTRGVPQFSITVVPDSGTGKLVGLAGKMTINIVEGKHFYEFEYTLSESH